MYIIFTIKYLMIIGILVYIAGLLLAWIYELRRDVLYRQMRQNLGFLEDSQKSGAVLQIWKYKITEDYRRNSLGLERVQQFILKNVLLIRRGTLKTEYKK